MVSQEWLEEARRYGGLSERERGEYWARLDASQQAALSEAVTAVQQAPVERDVLAPASTPTGRRGCSSPLAAGCLGVFLGVVLTIGAEVALLMMGIQAVGDLLGGFAGGGGGGGGAPTATAPIDVENASSYELLEYCGTELEEQYPRIARVCAEQAEMDRINEKVYRERQSQDD